MHQFHVNHIHMNSFQHISTLECHEISVVSLNYANCQLGNTSLVEKNQRTFNEKKRKSSCSTQCQLMPGSGNTFRLRQNGPHSADTLFKFIFFNENVRILFQISLKFVPKGPINTIPAVVQIMTWRWPGNKPLSEPMMVQSTDIRRKHVSLCLNELRFKSILQSPWWSSLGGISKTQARKIESS